MSYVGSPIIPRQGAAVPDGDTPIYAEMIGRLLFDPLPASQNPLDLTNPASRPDGSWCEDRDPAKGEITSLDGRE